MNEEMTSSELNKLITWLKSNGHTDSEIINCIAYMTGNEKAADTTDKITKEPHVN